MTEQAITLAANRPNPAGAHLDSHHSGAEHPPAEHSPQRRALQVTAGSYRELGVIQGGVRDQTKHRTASPSSQQGYSEDAALRLRAAALYRPSLSANGTVTYGQLSTWPSIPGDGTALVRHSLSSVSAFLHALARVLIRMHFAELLNIARSPYPDVSQCLPLGCQVPTVEKLSRDLPRWLDLGERSAAP